LKFTFSSRKKCVKSRTPHAFWIQSRSGSSPVPDPVPFRTLSRSGSSPVPDLVPFRILSNISRSVFYRKRPDLSGSWSATLLFMICCVAAFSPSFKVYLVLTSECWSGSVFGMLIWIRIEKPEDKKTLRINLIFWISIHNNRIRIHYFERLQLQIRIS
jgi:hypothetical protein